MVIRTRSGLSLIFAVAAFTLQGCGGLNADEKRMSEACNFSAFGNEKECACYAKEMVDRLDKEDLERWSELNDTAESDPDDMSLMAIDMAFDTESRIFLQRVNNASERALSVCMG